MTHLLKSSQYEKIVALRATSGVNAVEGQYLAYLAATYMKKTGVEIGSCEGRSACYILDPLKDKQSHATLHCIDLWELGLGETPPKHSAPVAYKRFKANIKSIGVAGHVHVYKGRSSVVAKTWTTPIDLLFIDGSHLYADVKLDYECWSPFVQVGGVMAFHDTNQDDIARVVAELPYALWLPLPTDESERIAAFVRLAG